MESEAEGMHPSSCRKAGMLLMLAMIIASIVPATNIFAVSLVHASPQKALDQFPVHSNPASVPISRSLGSTPRVGGSPRVMPYRLPNSVPAISPKDIPSSILPRVSDTGAATDIGAQIRGNKTSPSWRKPEDHKHKPFPPKRPEIGLLQNVEGLNDAEQAAVNGGPDAAVTPPDQGLCVGRDPRVPGTEVVFTAVNSALRETAPNGSALPGAPLLGNRDVSFANFWEPQAFTDPRCLYDNSTQTFFFTVIGELLNGHTTTDIAVYNALGFIVYQFDTSLGGTEFGDQPHIGYDNNAFYVSTDEFPNVGPGYNGAILVIISKPQLVAHSASVASATTGLLSLAGQPVLTLQPAISTSPTRTEYLLNSFPFPFSPNLSSNQLGFWTITNDTNPANAIITARTITSETYVFPVPALSTGTGITTGGITSEAALNPDDARMQQVQFLDGHLWAALTTSLLVDNDPTPRDGLAWFKIDAYRGTVEQQGYVGSLGNYLIYPAIFHTRRELTAIAFTVTSRTINPSAAYVVNNSPNKFSKKFEPLSFGEVSLAAFGSAAHYSFSDTTDGHEPRWGDYSAAGFDLDADSIWLATEYIPVFQSPFDNWGTRVFELGPTSKW